MSANLITNSYTASQNYYIQFQARSSCNSSQRSSVALGLDGASKRRRCSSYYIETIRSSSFLGTNIGKNKRYRQEPANKSLKSNSENKYFDLHIKKQIRSSKILPIFYSKLIVKKWISSITPPGGFEPDLNYFFLEELKITLSTASVGVEFESNCSKTPLNRPFSGDSQAYDPFGWFLVNMPKKLRFASFRSRYGNLYLNN